MFFHYESWQTLVHIPYFISVTLVLDKFCVVVLANILIKKLRVWQYILSWTNISLIETRMNSQPHQGDPFRISIHFHHFLTTLPVHV